MDKMVYCFINGVKRPLHYSMEVLFAVNDRFGNINNALEVLTKEDKDSFEALQFLAVAMANDAELRLRAEGYDHGKFLGADDITMRMKPVEYVNLIQAVTDAVAAGYEQEHKSENEEIDLGLAELRKKAEAGS